MIAAFVVSSLFLISYSSITRMSDRSRSQATGLSASLYFTILITHVMLAAVIVPMALVTLRAACGWTSRGTGASRAGRGRCGCTSR